MSTAPLARTHRPPARRGSVRRRSGFTLVEIMIVVLIIGVLAAIAVPNWVNARTTSRKSACITNLRRIETAKEQWTMDNKKGTGDATQMTDLAPTYIKSTPVCPGGGTYTTGVVGTSPSCTVTGHSL